MEADSAVGRAVESALCWMSCSCLMWEKGLVMNGFDDFELIDIEEAKLGMGGFC